MHKGKLSALAIALLAMNAGAAFAGEHGAGNGGEVVVKWVKNCPANSICSNALILLDLLEFGIEDTASINNIPDANSPVLPGYQRFDLGGKSSLVTTQWVSGFYDSGYPIRQLPQVLVDTPDQSSFRMIHDSAPLFGKGDKMPQFDVQYCAKDSYSITCPQTGVFDSWLANKFYEIRAAAPRLANAMVAKFKALTWILVDADLKPTNDSYTPIADSDIRQIAVRDDDIVRISRHGWEDFKDNNKNAFFHIHESVSGVALITHEILYALTQEQGDTTSKRARQINAYLYFGSPEMIQKAEKLLFGAAPKKLR